MNIILPVKPNRIAVAFVTGVLPKGGSTLPVLDHVKLSGNADETTITATDLDCTLVAILEADGSTPANNEPCLLPGKRIAELFRSGDLVTIDSNCKVANITHDGITFTMHQLPVKEWPCLLAEKKPIEAVEVSAEALTTAIDQVKDAMSDDASRYILQGINIELDSTTITLATSDGRRMHRAILLPDTHCAKKDFTLPASTVPHLLKLLKAQPKGGRVLLVLEDGRVRILGERLMLVSKLVDGNFPNYRQVIPNPDDWLIKLAVDVPAWLKALRSVEKFTSPESNSVRIGLTKNLATLTVSSPKLGSGTATLPVNYSGKGFAAAFNPYYLIEGLTPHKDRLDPVSLAFIDEKTPVTITTADTTTVIMPMRMS